MAIEEAIQACNDVLHWSVSDRINIAMEMAIEALKQIEAIENIINVSNLTIQEDVLKYKMIVDVVKGEW